MAGWQEAKGASTFAQRRRTTRHNSIPLLPERLAIRTTACKLSSTPPLIPSAALARSASATRANRVTSPLPTQTVRLVEWRSGTPTLANVTGNNHAQLAVDKFQETSSSRANQTTDEQDVRYSQAGTIGSEQASQNTAQLDRPTISSASSYA
jgi:hypothetical protein